MEKERFFLKEAVWGKEHKVNKEKRDADLKGRTKLGICLAPLDTDYSTVTSGLFCETRNMRLKRVEGFPSFTPESPREGFLGLL